MSCYDEIIKTDGERERSLKESLANNENFEDVNELLGLLVKYGKLEEVKSLIIYLLDITKHLPENDRQAYQGNLKRLFNSMAVNINDFDHMNWNYCDTKNKALIMLWKPQLLKGVKLENVDGENLKQSGLISKPYANLLTFYQARLYDVVDEHLEVSTAYGIKNALNCFYLNKPDFVLKLPEWQANDSGAGAREQDKQAYAFNLPHEITEAVDKMFYSNYNIFFNDSKLKKYLVSCCLYQYLNTEFETFTQMLKSIIAFLQLDFNVPVLMSDSHHSLITYAQMKGQPNIRYYEMVNDVIEGSKVGKVRGTKAKYEDEEASATGKKSGNATAYIITEITPDEHEKLINELEELFKNKDYLKMVYTFWNSQLLMRSTCLTGWVMLTLLTNKFYTPKTQYDWIACCYDFEVFKSKFDDCESVEISKIKNDEKLRLVDVLRNL